MSDSTQAAPAPATKPWWTSKTIWFNVVVLALGAAESRMNILQPLVPVNIYTMIAFGLPIVNLCLRSITTQGLSK